MSYLINSRKDMSQDENQGKDMSSEPQNIFEEFSQTQKIEEEVKRIEEKKERNSYYYLQKLNTFLVASNVLLVSVLLLTGVYIYIQTNDVKREYTFLQPICSVFLGDSIEIESCYGITPILNEAQENLAKEKEKQIKQILPLLGEIYGLENFNLSKKVSFLLEKTESRVKPLEILAAFDSIKIAFAPIDKSELTCRDISIDASNVLEIICDVYSSDWDTRIKTYNNGVLQYVPGGGTSISKASSFLSFIEEVGNSPFTIMEGPNLLNSEKVQLGPYTQKTTIQLRLQYNNTNIAF